MANRIPTYVDATSEKISEVPAGDFLSIEGSGLVEGHTALTTDEGFGSQVTVPLNTGGSFSLELTGNTTIIFENPPSTGACGFSLAITHDSTENGYVITWGNIINWPGGSAPELTSQPGKTDVFVFAINHAVKPFIAYTGLVAAKNIGNNILPPSEGV